MTKTYRVCIATEDIDDFTETCLKAGWAVLDTGERVSCDEGEDAEAVLVVSVFQTAERQTPIALTL